MMRVFSRFVVVGMLGCGGTDVPKLDAGTRCDHPPILSSATATSPSLVMGQSTGLAANATDADGGALTYSWTQSSPASPQGTFSSGTSASPTWTAPPVGVTTRFTLDVTVSDGKGCSATGHVTIFAKTSTDPSFNADIQPFLVQCFAGCHPTAPGHETPALAEYPNLVTPNPNVEFCTGNGQVLVKPGDPDNSVLIKTLIGTSCGPRMPPDGPYLGTDQLDLVRTWISQGAPNN